MAKASSVYKVHASVYYIYIAMWWLLCTLLYTNISPELRINKLCACKSSHRYSQRQGFCSVQRTHLYTCRLHNICPHKPQKSS